MLLDWIALQNNHKNISKMHSSNGTIDQYANLKHKNMEFIPWRFKLFLTN